MRAFVTLLVLLLPSMPGNAWADHLIGAHLPISPPGLFQSAKPQRAIRRSTMPQLPASPSAISQLALLQLASPLPSPLRPMSKVNNPPRAEGRTGGYRTIVPDPATLCETWVTTAEYVNRLPPRLLGAISLTESGRVNPISGRVRPWPWTINAEGEGQFFETRQQAIAAVKSLQDRGVEAIDVGCLQVNLMYHPDAFATLEEAFDPRSNANYAAHFLAALYVNSKDWAAAVAAYHSETPVLGDAYRALVMARWQNPDPQQSQTAQAYGDFAQADKAYSDKAHGAFAPTSRVYGAFAPR
jgi:hypothetical protein